MTTTTTLAARLATASIAVGALATDKRNAQQGYDYISSDKILERCGDALAHAGVIVIPAITTGDVLAVETRTSRGEGIRYDAEVVFAMTLTDGATTLEFPWRGRGSDYAVPDKAMYKAITSGHKYFLMKLLNVGVGNEDGEHDAVETPQPTQARNTTRTAPPRPAPPVQPVQQEIGRKEIGNRAEDNSGLSPISSILSPSAEDGDVIFDRNVPWYADARNNTTNGVRKLCDTTLELHHTGGPASNKQYGWLCGLIDGIVKQVTGAEDAHKRVLPVLCQAEISGANPPSAALASKMLDRLATHIKNDAGEKVENPNYSQAAADAMIAIYRAAEAVGTQSLLEPA